MQNARSDADETTGSKRPADSVRIGNIEASVWRNDNENGTFFSVSIQRHYKDSVGAWQSTTSFGVDDLPVVEKVAAKALDLALALQRGRGR